MLQNVHYFDQISNVRYANKVCFFRTYKTPQTLEITRIAGLLFKSTLFFAYYSARIAWIGSRLAALIAGNQPKQIPQILAITMLNNTPPA